MELADNLITLHFIRRLQRNQPYFIERKFKSLGELKGARLSDEKTAENLKHEEDRIPQFKLAPKIHREGNLVRPILSCIIFSLLNI